MKSIGTAQIVNDGTINPHHRKSGLSADGKSIAQRIKARIHSVELGVMMRARPLVPFSVAMLVASLGSASAQEPGNPQRGLAIARDVCAGCHAVENSDDASPNRMAPSFRVIAMTPGMTEAALHAALRLPHVSGSMPLVLPNEIDVLNVIAYIRSLDTR